ncbi:MAG: alpha/beta hydrolase [Chloroflexi bacterium]|nr:alpha/beta hydrolase [Chloroflexota bacterium]MCZ6789464.1 alpha/beta hydrolase [Chloroflexota bacterium]
MPLDPQAQAVLDQLAALNLPPNYTVTPSEARANAKLRPSVPGPEVSAVEARVIPGPVGDVPVRIYTPAGAGPFPVLVWFHGGGMVLGDLDMADGTARHLCVGAGCVVVSVDYRLAPEHTFPAAPEDCYAATEWVSKNAGSMDVDPNRMAVGGDSAGGNLATVVALMSRDRGGPPLAFQLVVYPMVDRDFTTESYRSNADGYLLTRDSMIWYWNHYVGAETDTTSPYAVPLRAGDLGGLPPALVITAEYDPLRDEGAAYADRLRAAGVPTVSSRYDGMIHGFFGMSAVLDSGKQAMAEACTALTEAFAGSVRL